MFGHLHLVTGCSMARLGQVNNYEECNLYLILIIVCLTHSVTFFMLPG